MLYMEFEEDLLDRIKKITKCSYYAKANLVNCEYITTIIEDLIYEYEVLKEELEDFKQDMEDNYIKRPMSDYTGNADDDRF